MKMGMKAVRMKGTALCLIRLMLMPQWRCADRGTCSALNTAVIGAACFCRCVAVHA
jgi:hypothetical protein